MCLPQVELVEPPEGSVPGEKVTVAGFEGQPAGVLKKDLFDAVAPKLRTNRQLEACYDGVQLRTSKGVCVVQSIAGGGIK